MVLGLNNEDMLVLVKRNSQNRLVFDELKPCFSNEKIMPLIPSSHPGKAVALFNSTTQYNNGMSQMLILGDKEQAINVFIDDDHHIRDADMPFQFLDGWAHLEQPAKFCTKAGNCLHQKYIINDDGTIALANDPNYVLGTDED